MIITLEWGKAVGKGSNNIYHLLFLSKEKLVYYFGSIHLQGGSCYSQLLAYSQVDYFMGTQYLCYPFAKSNQYYAIFTLLTRKGIYCSFLRVPITYSMVFLLDNKLI